MSTGSRTQENDGEEQGRMRTGGKKQKRAGTGVAEIEYTSNSYAEFLVGLFWNILVDPCTRNVCINTL